MSVDLTEHGTSGSTDLEVGQDRERDDVAELVAASRRRQGLPAKIEDASTLAKIAALLREPPDDEAVPDG
jgi:hypothetical protein